MKSVANSKRATVLRKLQQLAKKTKTKAYIPVAGYFVASHPHDRDIRRLNIQNTPDEAIEFLRRVNPDVVTWKPFPGGCFDLSTLSGPPSPPERTFLKTRWDHSKYIDTIKSLGLRALTRMEDLQTYFDWAQFNQYDLLLHVIETDDTFAHCARVLGRLCWRPRLNDTRKVAGRRTYLYDASPVVRFGMCCIRVARGMIYI